VVVGVMVLEGEVSRMEGMGWFETGYGVLRSLWMGFAGIGWSDGWRVLRILAYGRGLSDASRTGDADRSGTGHRVLRHLWMRFARMLSRGCERVQRILWVYREAHCTYMFRPRSHLNAKVRSRNVSHALRTLQLLILIRKTSRERIEQVIGLALNLSCVFVRICRPDVLVQSLYENATSTR
jgi:hypothetical protein